MSHSLQRIESFSLVEVTIALGVAAFCLVAIFGLLPIGFQTNQNAVSQTASASILSAVVCDLRATPVASGTSPQFGINIGSSTILYFDSEGKPATSTNARYRVTIAFRTNPAGATAATFAHLKVSWPAAADPAVTTASGSVESFAAFDRH